MKLTENLTKENFFNEMMELYPLAMKLFCNWVDEYKKAVNWNVLFNNGKEKNYGVNLNQLPNSKTGRYDHDIKFHDLPYAMQQGIWIEFVGQTLHHYFEQPEYQYSMDLEEDIKTVFKELEHELVYAEQQKLNP